MLTAHNSSVANTAHPRGQENKDAEKQQRSCSMLFLLRIIFPPRELYPREVDVARHSQGTWGWRGWRAGPPPAKAQLYFLTSPLTNRRVRSAMSRTKEPPCAERSCAAG